MQKFIFITILVLGIFFSVQGLCEEYKIDAEDVLSITVYDQPDLTSKVRVTAQGEITFPLVGNVKVSGLTLAEAEKKLAGLLEADYLVNPRVSIFMEEYHSKKVSVLGAIEKPGVYELSAEKPSTLLEAIAMAGGLTKKALGAEAKIMRMENGKETTIAVDINDITKRNEKDKDIQLKAKDVIFIPEGDFQIFVLGAVDKAGAYELSREKPMTALEAVAMAGGFTKNAALNETKVMRLVGGKEETILVPVTDITVRNQKEKDIVLRPKDTIFVPEGFFQVFVMGAVEKPGAYELSREKSTTVIEAIVMAGGFSKVADQNGTKIVRKDPQGREDTIRVRVADIMQKGEKDKDVKLEPKDVVVVPESFF